MQSKVRCYMQLFKGIITLDTCVAESRWTWQSHVETCSLCAQLKPASFLIYAVGQSGLKAALFAFYVGSLAACQQFGGKKSEKESQQHSAGELGQRVELGKNYIWLT